MNILIIDPNIPFQQSLKKLLKKHFPHVDVDVASDGQEGFGKMRMGEPQLILLEIHLRGESGLRLAGEIKSKHPDAIIALLTSDNLPEYQIAAKDSGIEHLIPKDEWTGDDIVSLVESIVSDLQDKQHV
jgi:DNA-binding NarL/FixJ family response regulator